MPLNFVGLSTTVSKFGAIALKDRPVELQVSTWISESPNVSYRHPYRPRSIPPGNLAERITTSGNYPSDLHLRHEKVLTSGRLDVQPCAAQKEVDTTTVFLATFDLDPLSSPILSPVPELCKHTAYSCCIQHAPGRTTDIETETEYGYMDHTPGDMPGCPPTLDHDTCDGA